MNVVKSLKNSPTPPFLSCERPKSCKEGTSKPGVERSVTLGKNHHMNKSPLRAEQWGVVCCRCLALPGLDCIVGEYPGLRFTPPWALMPRPYRTLDLGPPFGFRFQHTRLLTAQPRAKASTLVAIGRPW
jgi:hypothetical protein